MGGKVVGEYSKGKIDRLLTPELADEAHRHRVMQFLENMQAAVLEANCVIIGQEIPNLDRDSFLKLAVRVAELRADYIRTGLRVSELRHPDPAVIDELAQIRKAYEEMTSVSEAAQRVIERGYVKLG